MRKKYPFKVYFQERELYHLLFFLPSEWGVREHILSFKSRPHFGRELLFREVNRKSQKLFPFVKMVEKHGDVAIHIKDTEI